MKPRAEVLRGLATTSYDLCVIGAGASGAGCALDAQLRGIKTLLLDRGDFGGATSTASTKLVHGGLRYLRQAIMEFDFAEYRLVRTALEERSIMMRNAPQLTRTIRLAIPCANPFDAVYNTIGVTLYDWLSGKASLGRSCWCGRGESLGKMPWLKQDGLFGTVHYTDGQFNDARYNLALVQSFRAAGGDAANHVEVDAFEFDRDGRICGARASGYKVNARIFLNATGPFADRLRQLAAPAVRPRIKPSKGVHLLFPLPLGCQPDGSNAEGLLIPQTDDGRVIFALPWQGRLLVGTTETEAHPADEMIVTRAEAEYLLRCVNRYLASPFTLADVVGAFAGMRPLLAPDDSRNSSSVVRDFEVEVEPRSGLISLMGGKWTVYRAMAEHAVDVIEKRLKGEVTACRTRDYPLDDSGDPMIVHLDDLLNRREGLEYRDWRAAVARAPEAAADLARQLGWSKEQEEEEVRRYVGRLSHRMGGIS